MPYFVIFITLIDNTVNLGELHIYILVYKRFVLSLLAWWQPLHEQASIFRHTGVALEYGPCDKHHNPLLWNLKITTPIIAETQTTTIPPSNVSLNIYSFVVFFFNRQWAHSCGFLYLFHVFQFRFPRTVLNIGYDLLLTGSVINDEKMLYNFVSMQQHFTYSATDWLIQNDSLFW